VEALELLVVEGDSAMVAIGAIVVVVASVVNHSSYG